MPALSQTDCFVFQCRNSVGSVRPRFERSEARTLKSRSCVRIELDMMLAPELIDFHS